MGAMPASPDDLFAYLDALGISHSTVWHEAMFTVEQSSELKADMPGAHTKNLFLKDKDGQLVLIAAEAHGAIRLNQLHKLIGTARLNDLDPQAYLRDVLGRIATRLINRIDALLPWNWAQNNVQTYGNREAA